MLLYCIIIIAMQFTYLQRPTQRRSSHLKWSSWLRWILNLHSNCNKKDKVSISSSWSSFQINVVSLYTFLNILKYKSRQDKIPSWTLHLLPTSKQTNKKMYSLLQLNNSRQTWLWHDIKGMHYKLPIGKAQAYFYWKKLGIF